LIVIASSLAHTNRAVPATAAGEEKAAYGSCAAGVVLLAQHEVQFMIIILM
jgi:hypothetical protein